MVVCFIYVGFCFEGCLNSMVTLRRGVECEQGLGTFRGRLSPPKTRLMACDVGADQEIRRRIWVGGVLLPSPEFEIVPTEVLCSTA